MYGFTLLKRLVYRETVFVWMLSATCQFFSNYTCTDKVKQLLIY